MAVRKTSQKPKKKVDFKYVAKIGKGKDTRYFYTNAEYSAYLKGRKSSTNKPDTKTGVSTAGEAVGRVITARTKVDGSKVNSANTPTAAKLVANGKATIKKLASKLGKSSTITLNTEHTEDGKEKMKSIFGKAFAIAGQVVAQHVGKPDNTKQPEWAMSLDRKDTELKPHEDQALVNPKYDPYDPAYSQNCGNCTAAYDLRRRGYDVEAAPFDPNDPGSYNDIRAVSEWYEDTTVYDWQLSAPHDAETIFSAMPDGSYGNMGILWNDNAGGGAHSVVWERIGGQTVIRDCQSGMTYDYEVWLMANDMYTNDLAILRTDNREPSDKILKTVRNRKEED